MEQLTKNQTVATSKEAVQNQNEQQLRDENAHNDKSVHEVLNPTYQAVLRRDAVQPDIEAERKKRDEIEAGKSYFFFSSRRRHTSSYGDWSSDVCSSDLLRPVVVEGADVLLALGLRLVEVLLDVLGEGLGGVLVGEQQLAPVADDVGVHARQVRSEERRVGKECRCSRSC